MKGGDHMVLTIEGNSWTYTGNGLFGKLHLGGVYEGTENSNWEFSVIPNGDLVRKIEDFLIQHRTLGPVELVTAMNEL